MKTESPLFMGTVRLLTREEMRNLMAGDPGSDPIENGGGCTEPCSGDCSVLACCCEGAHGNCVFKKCVSSNLECCQACNGTC